MSEIGSHCPRCGKPTDAQGGHACESAEHRCPRDSDWCDGVICREWGIDCPNAVTDGSAPERAS
jgi:hypothetical protein